MQGVLTEGQEMIKQDADPAVRDAGLISAAQRVEHYEMAGYGTVRTYANLLAAAMKNSCCKPRWTKKAIPTKS